MKKIKTWWMSFILLCGLTTVSCDNEDALTFPEQPEFVLVVGSYGLVLLRNGDTGQTIEYYTYNSDYSVTYQLSGKKLILYDKAEKLTYAVLKCIVFR